MIDVFRIGVSIGMSNDVSPVIGTIQRDLAGLGRTLDHTVARFSAVRLAAMGAPGGTGPAWAGIAAVRAGAPPGREPGATAAALIEAAARAWHDALMRIASRNDAARDVRGAPGGAAPPLSRMLLLRTDAGPVVAAGKWDGRRVAADLSPVVTLVAGLARLADALRPGAARFTSKAKPAAGGGAAASSKPLRSGLPVVVPMPGTAGRDTASRFVTAPFPGPRGRGTLRHTASDGLAAPVAASGFTGEATAWTQQTRQGTRTTDALTGGFGGVARGLGTLGSVLAGNDWTPMFARLVHGFRAVAAAGHRIDNWAVATAAAAADLAPREAAATFYVHVLNAHEIGNATGEAVNRGLRLPAASSPSLPTPASTPWAPGLMPAIV